MMHLICFFGSLLFVPLAQASEAQQQYQIWQGIRERAPGPPQAVGSYSAGCLAGAQALSLEGPGYAVMRPSRLRYFGHPTLVRYIERLGRELQKEKSILLVGDLGRPRGGPMLSGHVSHQSGLDVDLWLRVSKKRPTRLERERWSAPNFVNKDRSLGRAWTASQRKLLALAAAAPEVDRIFVSPSIKRDLCEKMPKAAWLHKVRAWWGHEEHLHVRLRCPEGDTQCENQEPLEASRAQCEEDLAWWFSPAAEEEWKKRPISTERPFPELPKFCQQLVEVS